MISKYLTPMPHFNILPKVSPKRLEIFYFLFNTFLKTASINDEVRTKEEITPTSSSSFHNIWYLGSSSSFSFFSVLLFIHPIFIACTIWPTYKYTYILLSLTIILIEGTNVLAWHPEHDNKPLLSMFCLPCNTVAKNRATTWYIVVH